MRWSPNKSHETEILRSPRQFSGSALGCLALCCSTYLKLWNMRWVLLLLLLVGLLTRLVDQRSLVSGIGSSLGLSWKAMKIKCQTSQPLLGQPSARQIEQIKFTFVFTVHIFLTQLLKSKRFSETKSFRFKVRAIIRKQIKYFKSVSTGTRLSWDHFWFCPPTYNSISYLITLSI